MKARPTEYTSALATSIAARLANGERLEKVCHDALMPDIATVSEWLSGGEHRDFEEMFCWAQERRDGRDYAQERWGPFPMTPVDPSDVSVWMEEFIMRPAATRQFQYVDDGADFEKEIRARRFLLSVVNGGKA